MFKDSMTFLKYQFFQKDSVWSWSESWKAKLQIETNLFWSSRYGLYINVPQKPQTFIDQTTRSWLVLTSCIDTTSNDDTQMTSMVDVAAHYGHHLESFISLDDPFLHSAFWPPCHEQCLLHNVPTTMLSCLGPGGLWVETSINGNQK